MISNEQPRLRSWAPAVVLTFAGAVVSFNASRGAETRIVGAVGSKEKTIESLTVQVSALEMRVKKLEAGLIAVQRTVNKPDSPDDDGGSDKPDKKGSGGGKNGSAGGPGANESGTAGSNQSGTASTQGDNSGSLKDVAPNTAHATKPSSSSGIAPMTVRAPFLVVDSTGRTILRVNDPTEDKPAGERGVYIYGATGAADIAITTAHAGGKVFINSDDNVYSVVMGAVSDGAALKVRTGTKLRTFVGLDNSGNGLIDVYGKDGEQPAAGLQLSEQGKGLVAVFNANTPVAFLTQSGSHPGGGNVTVTEPGGSGVFSAGYDGEGGAACVNHKQSMHCLGIGLPLGGGQ